MIKVCAKSTQNEIKKWTLQTIHGKKTVVIGWNLKSVVDKLHLHTF